MKEKVIFNWSGGKDSAFCLYKILQTQQYDIQCLLTSISQQYQRISMHGVRVNLLEAQAAEIGLPLKMMQIPDMPSMEDYEKVMSSTLSDLKAQGATASVFGDIFLEDLRAYREAQSARLNLEAVFPLWKIPTDSLVLEFIDLGFKAITTCVNARNLDQSFVGRMVDRDFIKDLPSNIDPCGENGEFHTFVFDGPIFKDPVRIEKGEIVFKEYNPPNQQTGADPIRGSDRLNPEKPSQNGFWYCDFFLSQIDLQDAQIEK